MPLEAKIYGKHGRDLLKFGTELNRLWFTALSAVTLPPYTAGTEHDSLESVHLANVLFALNVKRKADVFGFDSEHRDIEQTLTLK
jgi:hypothetical protein